MVWLNFSTPHTYLSKNLKLAKNRTLGDRVAETQKHGLRRVYFSELRQDLPGCRREAPRVNEIGDLMKVWIGETPQIPIRALANFQKADISM